MELLIKTIYIPLWQLLIITLYAIVMQIYVTYRLAREIDNLASRLKKLIT